MARTALFLRTGGGDGARAAMTADDARVDDGAHTADGLEVELVAAHLRHHEAVIGIEPGGRVFRSRDVVDAQLAGRSRDEVLDAVLNRIAFVEVLVPRKDYLDFVFDEERLDYASQI